MMSFKSKILAFCIFCIPLIIFLEIMMVIITKSFICFGSFICFSVSFILLIIVVAIIKSYQMAPGKSWVLVGPANESGMFALSFMLHCEELFVKRVKVPSESLCPMCNKIISTRKSQFYILFNEGLDALEMVIHRECIDQYAKTAEVDFKRDLKYINLNERVKKGPANMVHLINLGTQRKLDLYLLDHEPKFSEIFNYPLIFNPEIFTYEEFEKYIMDKQTRIDDQLGLLKRQDRRMFSHYKQEFKFLKGEIKAFKKELIKVRTYKKHYHALFEPVDTPNRDVLKIVQVEVFGPCSVCGQQFSLTDKVLMLYSTQKQKIEAFLHLHCKNNDTKSRKIYKWNSHIKKEDFFSYRLTSQKVKVIKKFDDCLFLETDQNTRELMFGNIAVPGKTVVMVEDNTCVCDMDCNCNCNCNCG